MLVKLEWLGYHMVKKLWRYVKPFSSDTGTLRTDRQTSQTDRFVISILRVSVLTRDKKWMGDWCYTIRYDSEYLTCTRAVKSWRVASLVYHTWNYKNKKIIFIVSHFNKSFPVTTVYFFYLLDCLTITGPDRTYYAHHLMMSVISPVRSRYREAVQ